MTETERIVAAWKQAAEEGDVALSAMGPHELARIAVATLQAPRRVSDETKRIGDPFAFLGEWRLNQMYDDASQEKDWHTCDVIAGELERRRAARQKVAA